MLRRLKTWVTPRVTALALLEVALAGVFFIQTLRFLIGLIYGRLASASQFPALDLALVDPAIPGLVDPATVSAELSLLAYMLGLPMFVILIGRWRILLIAAAGMLAAGRYLMTADAGIDPMTGATIALGGGLLYIAFLIRHRARLFPLMMIYGFALDQIFRAAGNTIDPTWAATFAPTQLILSIALIAIATLTTVIYANQTDTNNDRMTSAGVMTFWGGMSFGGLLYLQLSLLALPNGIAARANTDYTLFVPLTLLGTLLPLAPWIRGEARRFVSLFDSGLRGWVWMLLIALLIVIGTRLSGIIAGVALIAAQFMTGMIWWWLIRPKRQKERNLTGIWMVFGVLVFIVFLIFDTFTYEYAFVRDFAPELEFLNPIIPPLLRGFRGLGLAVILLALFIAAQPLIHLRRRIAWEQSGSFFQTVLAAGVIAGLSVWGAYNARPPVIIGVNNPPAVRVATYNLHAGFNEFYHFDMEAIALTIGQSGANVVLLQEVESGRLTSFGVDQPLWLGRRLGMDVRFFPTNEGLQGLAVLSNIEIVFDDGTLLDSVGLQTGLQRVQVRPDAGVITVYNTWLDPLLDVGTDIASVETSQLNQLSQIFQIITAHHQPEGILGRTVIGGTFNNIPDSDLIRRIAANGFIDHFAGQSAEVVATFWRTGQFARLDYLWTTRNLPAIGALVIDTHPSDHRLAVIEVALR